MDYKKALGKLARDPVVIVSVARVALFLRCALFPNQLAPYDPYTPNPALRLRPPNSAHLLGTDEIGRDILSRVIHGSRVSMLVGAGAVGFGLLFGGTIGLISGYYRRADKWLMRVIDVFMCFPYVLRAVAVVAIIGPGMTNLMIAVGTGSLPLFARLMRSSVLSKREEDYVLAAVALGAKNSRIIVSHILPNIIGPIIVSATLEFARAVLSVATLSFLNLGIQPPTPEWGSMASSGRTYLQKAPHLIFVPSIAIFLMAMAWNLLGDTLRDILDPRLKER